MAIICIIKQRTINRKIRRKKELEARKQAKKASKKLSEQVSRMPTKCGECGAVFDRSNKEMINEWRIAVYDDGPIHLVCPACIPDDVKMQK